MIILKRWFLVVACMLMLNSMHTVAAEAKRHITVESSEQLYAAIHEANRVGGNTTIQLRHKVLCEAHERLNNK